MGAEAELIERDHGTQVPDRLVSTALGPEDPQHNPLHGRTGAGSAESAARWVTQPVMRSSALANVRAMAMRRAQHNFGNQLLAMHLQRSMAALQRQCSCGSTCPKCQTNKTVQEEKSQPP